ncbi:MAG TPA: hypothetical protein VFO84_05395 [Dehalococcoidia bacterium]|nr:hypothetical protein [Dehalococcoidia bacterium]
MSARRFVLISTLFFLPLAVGGTVLFGILLINAITDGASGGDIFLLVIVGLITGLVAFQGTSAFFDLRSDYVMTEGPVLQKWTRNDFVVFGESCFVRVQVGETDKVAIFKIDNFWWHQVKEGDRVLIRHLPHTSSVESFEKL